MKTLLSILFLGASSYAAPSPYILCDELLRKLDLKYQEGAVGKSKSDLVTTLPRLFSQAEYAELWKSTGAVPPEAWFRELHEDVLEYLVQDPSTRVLKKFEAKYGLKEDQALNLLTYFASRQYFNAVRNLGDPRAILGRLSALSRAHRLTEPTSLLARRYPFYLTQITKSSIPQIAQMLTRFENPDDPGHKVSEEEVYKDILNAGISIEREFAPIMKRAKPLLDSGIPVAQVATVVGAGEDALRFHWHYQKELLRGVSWKRKLVYDGKTYVEEDLLKKLWGTMNSQDIADALNKAAGTQPGALLFRSTGSVWAKALLLKLTSGASRDFGDLELPGYGDLKIKGELQPSVISFLYDHSDLSLPQLARKLQVHQNTLRGFMLRNDVALLEVASTKRLPEPLDPAAYGRFTDSHSGLLVQLAQNRRGFSSKADREIELLAKEKIPEGPRLNEILSEIDSLNIRPTDGMRALAGKVPAVMRIQSALRLIAAEMGHPLSRFDQNEGVSVFGFRSIIEELSPLQHSRFVDPHQGLLFQLAQNHYGFGENTLKTLESIAAEQVTDEAASKQVLQQIRDLGISSTEGQTALSGTGISQAKIARALERIAEGKGRVLSDFTHREGTAVFGFLPLLKIPPSSLIARFTDPENGLLRQTAQNRSGFAANTDRELLSMVEEQITDLELREKVLGKVKEVGIKSDDGRNALYKSGMSAIRIHAALSAIAEGKGQPLKTFDQKEGAKVFGFRPIFQGLSPIEQSKFTDPTGLFLQLLENSQGYSKKTDEFFHGLIATQLPDEVARREALTKMVDLGIRADDLSKAKRGRPKIIARLGAMLRVIVEGKGGELKDFNKTEGARFFGWK